MIPRLFLVIIIILLQLPYIEKSNNNFKYRLAFILLFLFAALRGTGDGDYFSYLKYSKLIISVEDILNTKFPMEIGFRMISYINNYLGLHEQVVIMTMNLISLGCIYRFVKRYSSDKMLSIILFLPIYFQFDMHAARAAVALSISTLGFKYMYEKKIFKYVGIVFLASCFHKSAWILLPVYFIIDIRVKKHLIWLTTIFVFLISNMFSMNRVVLKLLNLLPFKTFANRFQNYMNSGVFGYPFRIYDPRLLLVVLIFVLALILLSSRNRFENMMINFIWLNLTLMLILRENTIFITRIVAYFNIYTIVIIPEILAKCRYKLESKEYHVWKLSMIYIYIAYISRFIILSIDYKLFFTS